MPEKKQPYMYTRRQTIAGRFTFDTKNAKLMERKTNGHGKERNNEFNKSFERISHGAILSYEK